MTQADRPEYSHWHPVVHQLETSLPKKVGPSTRNVGMGVGGIKHQYLQLLIKQLANEAGYRATIEAPITNSLQRVDVSVEGHGVLIACEIPISTRYKELGNIQKCLDAGYDHVISIAVERRTLEIVRRQLEPALSAEDMRKVRFFYPEELEEFLKQLQVPLTIQEGEQLIRGYRVKTKFIPVSTEEIAAKRKTLLSILTKESLQDSK